MIRDRYESLAYDGRLYDEIKHLESEKEDLEKQLKVLQQENKQLKEDIKSQSNYQIIIDNENAELRKEKDNLKSILTELEEWLTKIAKNGADIEKLTCSNILVYLKELKEKYK